MPRGDRIGQPVRADGVWLRIINAHAAQWFSASVPADSNPRWPGRLLRTSGVARGTTLHNAAPSGTGRPTNFRSRSAAVPSNQPAVGMSVCRTTRRPIRQADVRVRVADVEKQNHSSNVASGL